MASANRTIYKYNKNSKKMKKNYRKLANKKNLFNCNHDKYKIIFSQN